MSVSNTKKKSKTNWALVDSLKDEHIDRSEVPELGNDFFRKAELWRGPKKQITLRLDSDVIGYFQSLGRGYQTRINSALRTFVEKKRRSQQSSEASIGEGVESSLDAVRAMERFIGSVSSIPYLGALETVHSLFGQLRKNKMFAAQDAWMAPVKLANFAKYALLYGPFVGKEPLYDISIPLNAFSDFWSAIEKVIPYENDVELMALFVLRLSYQQMPFIIFEDRLPGMIETTAMLYSEGVCRKHFDRVVDIPLDRFLEMNYRLFEAFRDTPVLSTDEIEARQPVADRQFVKQFLNFLSADRSEFCRRQRLSTVLNLYEIPYEFNALLTYPVIAYEDKYWAPYPELITYAGTRGLYFRMGDVLGQGFKIDFGASFERYVRSLLSKHLPNAKIVSEQEEIRAGFDGKVNDISIIIGETVLLFECKTSALYMEAKRNADAETVRGDLEKTIRKALSQHGNKVRALRDKAITPTVRAVYGNVNRVIAITLLYDQIQFANAPYGLRVIVDRLMDELDIEPFLHQVWHLEELQNLLELTPSVELLDVIEQKLGDEKTAGWDLNTFLFEKHGLPHLRPTLYIPKQAERMQLVFEAAKSKKPL